MTSATERDREIAQEWLPLILAAPDLDRETVVCNLIATARDEGLERAAVIAAAQRDESSKAAYTYDGGAGSMGYESACDDIAQAIRSEKQR